MRTKTKEKRLSGLLILAFIFLINPNVNIYDILPDCIAYFIIFKKLDYAKDRSPFFDEAREAFKKLAIVTLIKIPASLLMTSIRSENYGDNDIRSLFAVTFAIIEAVLIVTAVKNLFEGFSYLGQRSDNRRLISDFPLNKPGSKVSSPDALARLTYIFGIYKCLLAFLPETLLLTRIVTSSEYEKTFNFARLYPYTVVFGIVTVLWFGIVWMRRFCCYIKSFNNTSESTEGSKSVSEIECKSFKDALDSMLDDFKRTELEAKKKIEGIAFGLTLLLAGAVLTLELRFDNLQGINLIPPFLFGFIMIFSSMRLSSFSEKDKKPVIFASLFTVSAFIRYAFEFSFLEKYGYEVLVTDPNAKSSYRLLIFAFIAEVLMLMLFEIFFTRLFTSFVYKNTGADKQSDRYSRQDKEYHGILKRKVYIFAVLTAFLWLAKLTECVLRYFSENTFVSWETSDSNLPIIRPDSGMVSESPLPWFGVVVVILSVVYIVYTFLFTSSLKEDAEMKYSKN